MIAVVRGAFPQRVRRYHAAGVLRRRPLHRGQGTVELQVLVDHALVIVTIACALVGPVGVRSALFAILGKLADGGCQAGSIVRAEIDSIVAPDFAETGD